MSKYSERDVFASSSRLPRTPEEMQDTHVRGGDITSKTTRRAHGEELVDEIGQSCSLCKYDDTNEMVQCDKCDAWFHYNCVGVTDAIAAPEVQWCCRKCDASSQKETTKSNKSNSSKRSQLKSLNAEIVLIRRIAEEKERAASERVKQAEEELRLFREKMRLENESSETSEDDDMGTNDRREITRKWIESDSCVKNKQQVRGRNASKIRERYVPNIQLNPIANNKGGECIENNYGRTTGRDKGVREFDRESDVNHERLLQENEQLKRQLTHMKSQHREVQQMNENQPLSQANILARQLLGKCNLPDFYGNATEWPMFISQYHESSARCGFQNWENLERLKRCLKGHARDHVQAMLCDPALVPEIIGHLKMVYGQPDTIVGSIINQIEKESTINGNNLQGLISFAFKVRNIVATVKAASDIDSYNTSWLVQKLVPKLPIHMQVKWVSHKKRLVNANLVNFSDWLYEFAEDASCVINNSSSSNTSKVITQTRGAKSTIQATHSESNYLNCQMCNINGHQISKCEKFKKLNIKQKYDVLNEKNLCKCCLGQHIFKNCRNKKACEVDDCPRPHHPLLHKSNHESNKPNDIVINNSNGMVALSSDCLPHSLKKNGIYYRIAPVKLYGNGKIIETFAFFDEGSSLTLMDNELVKELGIKGPKQDLCMKWTSNFSRVEIGSMIVSIKVSGVDKRDKQYHLKDVRTVQELNLPSQTFQISEDDKIFKHLRKIPINEYVNAKPKLLIGNNNYRLIVPLDIRESGGNTPVATKSRLGWTVCGPISKIKPLDADEHSLTICECDQHLCQLVKDYFSLENVGVQKLDNELVSTENSRAIKLLNETTKYINGRFETGLLWKNDNVILPDSYEMAKRRLLCLEKKMSKHPDISESLKKQLNEYLTKGYIRKLRINELAPGPRTWYLPMFIIQNPNKPEKKRIVWDAAARVGNVSLNSGLLTGPDLLISLVNVLYRFREGAVAIVGDLKEMFHQILINESDQDSQRFLWRNGDTSKEPEVYIMRVMTFGATCSPCSSQFVKNLNANKFKNDYPQAVETIEQDTYVDDWLKSMDSEAELIEVAKQVQRIHEYGGFTIHNWCSNSQLVLHALDQNHRIYKNFTDKSSEKILGMRWCTTNDKFMFKINYNKIEPDILNGMRSPTKREILRVVMSVYDPLGLIACFMVFIKNVLQEIWRESTGWDEAVQDHRNEQWQQWVKQFDTIESIQIPRHYFGRIDSPEREIQLHIFTDASESSYAAVAYFRTQDSDGVKCSLVSAKTKVAPTKPLSIPRLELQAGVIGSRLAENVMKGHNVTISKRYFWSDSQTLLKWLNSSARKYRPFVALRIGELLESTDAAEWRYVPSKMNVADQATKWKNKQNFQIDNTWFNGPEFLNQPESEWPKFKEFPTTDEDQELKSINVHSHVEILAPTTPDASRFSSWSKLVRAQVMFSTAVKKFKAKRDGNEENQCYADKFRDAENCLYKKAQWDVYEEEIRDLVRYPEKSLSKSSNIFKYCPYLDEKQMIRMKGRIDNAECVNGNVKRPIILPRNHKITDLIVLYYHQKYLHQNNEIVINEIRQKFVLPGIRPKLKEIRRHCQWCKNKYAMPEPPMMGNLPKGRVAAFIRPFSYVGVDYFGPIDVAVGRKIEKRWAVLYTCMTIRGVHIEIAHSLSTDSCLMCLSNFIAQRGRPLEIFSDNGTNFQGASNELQHAMKSIDNKKFIEKHPHIKWNFNPPSAPHMGGAWERLIRIVKSNLGVVMPERKPTDEVLRASLKEVENVVNSRPLSNVPLESMEDDPLTPNHFLLGSSNGHKPLIEVNPDTAALRNNFKKVQLIANNFWKKFVKSIFPIINHRSKWYSKSSPIQPNDIVIIVDNNLPRNSWLKGVIVKVHEGPDGQVRSAVIRTPFGTYTRPTVKIIRLDLKSTNVDEGVALVVGEDTQSRDVASKTTNVQTCLEEGSILIEDLVNELHILDAALKVTKDESKPYQIRTTYWGQNVGD